MGTTLTAIQAGRANLDWIIAIEGVPYILTTGLTSAAVTAWSGADQTAAIGNLSILSGFEQRLEPWKGTPDVSTITFAVMPSADTAAGDIFGRLVFGQANGVETFLDAALDVNDTTVTVLSTSEFASSGEIHIGTECIAYTGKTATTFTGCTRGKYAPLTQSGGRFAHEHRIPTIADGVTMPPKVTSLPRDWPGRWVTIWAHQVTGGVLDVKAQAQRMWAGRIVEIQEEANGCTYITCEDVRGKLRDTTLLHDQLVGRVREGIYLKAGWELTARDTRNSTSSGVYSTLTVVDSGASGDYEINKGTYTNAELRSAIAAWLAAGVDAGDLLLTWKIQLVAGPLTELVLEDGLGLNVAEFTAPSAVMAFLGWANNHAPSTPMEIQIQWTGTGTRTMQSTEEPYRTFMYDTGGGTNEVNFDTIRGTWFNNRPTLPAGAGAPLSGNYGIVQVNDGPMALVQYVDSDTFSIYNHTDLLDDIAGVPWVEVGNLRRVRYSQEGEIRLRQVAVMSLKVKWALLMTMTSTGVADFNYTDPHGGDHGDDLPAQLGAGIPYEFLGDNFYNSVHSMDESLAAILVVIKEPTAWTKVFAGDLAARMVHLVWKSGGLVLKTWGTPTAAHAEHVFTEANKQNPTSARDTHRTPAKQTGEWVRNVIKLEYGYTSSGEPSSVSITAPASIDSFGSRPVTLEMRNMYGGINSTYATITELADNLGMWMSTFARPLHVLHRTMPPTFFGGNVAPGDFCTVTDLFARNPSDGTRGLSSRPGIVTRVMHDWGGRDENGEPRPARGTVDILILPQATYSIYSPSARVDHTQANGGYDAGTKVLTCEAHHYSESSEDADATHFDVGENVYVVEEDPADPASFLSWSDEVAAQSGNTITLTTGLAGWDSGKFYRIVSDTYSTAIAAQQSDVYQADDADGMIADTVGAYGYGNDPGQATEFTESNNPTDADRPRLYANTNYGDGRPLSTALEFDAARLINAMVNYRCTSMINTLRRSTPKTYTGTGRKILEVQPVHFGPGELFLGDKTVRIGAWCRSTDGTSTTITISLCRYPPTGSSFTSTDLDAMDYALQGPYETWTSDPITSTSYGLQVNDFSIRSADPLTGIAYIVVEGASKLETRGICQGQPLAYSAAA